MPFTLFSHQAPVLLFRKRSMTYISIFWMSIGTIVPDLELIFRDNLQSVGLYEFYWGHSLFGQFFWTVPVSLLLVFPMLLLLGHYQTQFEVPKIAKTFFHDINLNNMFSKKGIVTAIISSFIGGLTHVILDGFTHQSSLIFYPIAVIDFDAKILGSIQFIDKLYEITLFEVMWFSLSLTLGLITFNFFIKYLRNLIVENE